jgi:hypothetical protein
MLVDVCGQGHPIMDESDCTDVSRDRDEQVAPTETCTRRLDCGRCIKMDVLEVVEAHVYPIVRQIADPDEGITNV